jgi:hypothetical protein
MLVTALVFALILTLGVAFALVAETMDSHAGGGAPTLPVWSRPLEQESAVTRSAHPGGEPTTMVPWACAFWLSGPGPFC